MKEEIKRVETVYSIHNIAGLKVFAFNKVTHELYVPKKEKVNVKTKDGYIEKLAYPVNNDIIYVQALNVKNAIRKLNKIGYDEIKIM